MGAMPSVDTFFKLTKSIHIPCEQRAIIVAIIHPAWGDSRLEQVDLLASMAVSFGDWQVVPGLGYCTNGFYIDN